ncbi:tRNA (adenosine(37)-N6)-threonylcarbamoyltransferase complex ATPase subunit type 1 TsaE [Kiloniella sp. EL199]|uniref:tRNA (adenosine(37)-N6)-threonylcarbamoyltransferase complex ATPase subunit type 1 TsaE n=1 Tax=Kiloniella sp. EL199 TaxID=2107581 RepID=UPI0020B114C0|nr:tRNA (adenosine(37)-N6)-threonylcarbamoyltransferase complex ATPase subunit type 1 TsaE [Kiloniella sp. EL199]
MTATSITAENFIGEIAFADENETREFARKLAPFLYEGDVLALDGDLGAGKTAFSRALINAFPAMEGMEQIEEVPSPTFTLVQIYDRADKQIWHFDLYRLEDAEEAYELGIEEAFSEGISLIEWPDRLGFLMPRGHLQVKLSYGQGETARVLKFFGGPKWRERFAPLFS